MKIIFFLYKNLSKLRDYFFSYIAKKILGVCDGKSFVRYPYYLFNPDFIRVGNCFTSGPGLRLEAWDEYKGNKYFPEIQIGNNVSLNYNVHIGAIKRISIGDNVLVGSNVVITDHSHGDLSKEIAGTFKDQPLHSKGEVVIEENVWIGENVSVLPGVTIGRNTVVGANSVVTCDVPESVVVCGVPAEVKKRIRTR